MLSKINYVWIKTQFAHVKKLQVDKKELFFKMNGSQIRIMKKTETSKIV